MLIDVHLFDTETGERAVYDPGIEYDGWDEDDEFLWSEGNYACDCNRGHFFARALGRPDISLPCRGERMCIEKIVERGTDRILYEED